MHHMKCTLSRWMFLEGQIVANLVLSYCMTVLIGSFLAIGSMLQASEGVWKDIQYSAHRDMAQELSGLYAHWKVCVTATCSTICEIAGMLSYFEEFPVLKKFVKINHWNSVCNVLCKIFVDHLFVQKFLTQKFFM